MVVSVAGVGCADTSDQTGASIEESEVPGLTQRVSFGQVEMDLPENGGVYSTGNSAVVGVLAGGNCDVPLRLEIHYDKDVDKLVPTCCPQHTPPVRVTAVRTIESGFRPVGDKTAQQPAPTRPSSDGRGCCPTRRSPSSSSKRRRRTIA